MKILLAVILLGIAGASTHYYLNKDDICGIYGNERDCSLLGLQRTERSTDAAIRTFCGYKDSVQCVEDLLVAGDTKKAKTVNALTTIKANLQKERLEILKNSH